MNYKQRFWEQDRENFSEFKRNRGKEYKPDYSIAWIFLPGQELYGIQSKTKDGRTTDRILRYCPTCERAYETYTYTANSKVFTGIVHYDKEFGRGKKHEKCLACEVRND